MRRKRKTRRKWIGIIVILALCGVLAPVISHLGKLSAARENYDFDRVTSELSWFKDKSSLFERIPAIKETGLWLRLNMGDTDGLEAELSGEGGDQYRFWLFTLQLQSGRLEEAQATLGKIAGKGKQALGQAILLLSQGEGEAANQKLQEEKPKLSDHEKTLWALYLAQSWLMLDDPDRAAEQLEAARAIEPQSPMIAALEFQLALAKGDWEKADQLIVALDQAPERENDPSYRVQKGMLALYGGREEEFKGIIDRLETLSPGHQAYLLGMEALGQGRLTEGRDYLEESLQSDLPVELKADATQALAQVEERIKANQDIRLLTGG